MFELIIFDCDGVLVDTEPIAIQVLSGLLMEHGLDVDPDEVSRRSVGRSNPEIWQWFSGQLGRPLPQDFMERNDAKALEQFRLHVKPQPGVTAAVEYLAGAGIPMSVASNGPIEKMQVTLGGTGLMAYFGERLFSAEQVPNGKPAPDVYLLAAREMGATPSRCLVVEDSFPGAQAGLAAGMTVMGYCPDGDIWGLEQLGVETFADMKLLPGLIGLR